MRSRRSLLRDGLFRVRWTRWLGTACSAIVALVATNLVAGFALADQGLERQQPEHKSISERVEAVRERAGPEPLELLGFDESHQLLAQWYNWGDWLNDWDNYWSNWSNY